MVLPSWAHVILARCRALFHRRDDDRALDDEMALHVALMEERLLARGLSSDEAHREARRAFGGLQQLRESHRDARSFAWLTQAGQDAVYALRMLRRQPSFTAAAILTLALGIGANTAVFSVVDAVLLRPLPYPSPDRVERVGWNWDDHSPAIGAMAPFKFEYLRDHGQAFAQVGVWQSGTRDIGPRGSGGPVHVLRVSNEFFPVVGSWPSPGRAFTDGEQQPGAVNAAILSDACWTVRFGRDQAAIGGTVVLDDRPYTVVGVMPSGFEFPEETSTVDVVVPLALKADPTDLGANYSVIGRVRPGLPRAAVQADLDRVFADLRRERPDQFSGPGERGVLMTFDELNLAGVARPLWTLLAGVAVVLLIACTNVANLLLARGATRLPEMAIRSALGASRARIIRQGITEGIVLAAMGGVAGVTLGVIGVRAFLDLAPFDVTRLNQVRLDGIVLGFTALVVLVTGVLFGLASTQLGRRRDSGSVSLATRGTANAAAGRRLRQWMVGLEAGLAMLLLVAAVLLSSAFYQLARTNLGFDPRGLVALSFRRTPPEFRSAERVRTMERSLLKRLAGVPGVRGAAATSVVPLGERGSNIPMTVVGRPDATEGAVEWRAVSHDYTDVVGLRLLAGRWFTEDDVAANRPVAIVNASVAARYWPDASPIGQRFYLGVFRGEIRPGTHPTALEIVGVVNDVRELGPTRAARRTVLVPEVGTTGVTAFLVRGTEVSVDALRAAVRDADPALPEPIVSTFEARLASRLSKDRFASVVTAMFATVALLLTAIGVYGVVSWVVRQTTREIGIRMALGAAPRDVLGQVLLRGLMPVVVGLFIGGLASIAASQLVVGFVAGATRVSPSVMLVAAAVLTVIAAIAAGLPARRAMMIDPVAALRME